MSKKKIKLLKPLSRAQFNRLSADRKRVLIAQDVLAQLALGRYRAMSGTYIQLDCHANGVFTGAMARKADPLYALLNRKYAPECTVCGIGAACCSAVRLFDQAKYIKEDGVKRLQMWPTINEYFPNASKQPEGGIEYWFERTAANYGDHPEWCDIVDDAVRMEAIFKQIIDQKGKENFPGKWWRKHVGKEHWDKTTKKQANAKAKAELAKLEKQREILDSTYQDELDALDNKIADLEDTLY